MVDRPLLPTASNLGTHLVFRPFLCNATPPMFLIILKFLSQGLGLGLGLGNAANGWRYLGPPLRHCCRLQACWSKGKGGGYEERSHVLYVYICYVYYVVYTMLYTYYIYSITTIWMYIWKYMNVNNILNLYMKVYECIYETIWKYMNVYSVCKYTQVYEYILCVLCSI